MRPTWDSSRTPARLQIHQNHTRERRWWHCFQQPQPEIPQPECSPVAEQMNKLKGVLNKLPDATGTEQGPYMVAGMNELVNLTERRKPAPKDPCSEVLSPSPQDWAKLTVATEQNSGRLCRGLGQVAAGSWKQSTPCILPCLQPGAVFLPGGIWQCLDTVGHYRRLLASGGQKTALHPQTPVEPHCRALARCCCKRYVWK